MSEAILIFPNMRGGCATVGNKVHALFRVNGRRPGISTSKGDNAPSINEQPSHTTGEAVLAADQR
jgi:hypothetical protein